MKKKLIDLLNAAFAPTYLNVIDESALHEGHRGIIKPYESHFRIEIVSVCFHDKARLIRHRLIYQALESAFMHGVHAVAIAAYTPEEYLAKQRGRE